MADPRWETLAETLVTHSLRLTAGETVLIEAFDLDEIEPVRQLIRKACALGARPLLELKDTRLVRELVTHGDAEQLALMGQTERYRMERVEAYVALRGARNINEMADVPGPQMRLYNEHVVGPVHFQQRVPHTKWCVLRLPNASMAQQAGMSTEAFRDFYFEACNLDYAWLAEALGPLVARMKAAREVRIQGPETDLRFSIADMPVVPWRG